ncbi:hypothetical protein ACTFIY_009595 [Dictyostelium cf. discoideum]
MVCNKNKSKISNLFNLSRYQRYSMYQRNTVEICEPSNNDTLGIILIVIGGIIFFIGFIMLACSYTISSSIYKGNINKELSIVNENFKPKGIVWELETENVYYYRKRYTIKINIPRSIRQNLVIFLPPQLQPQPQIFVQPNIINNTITDPYYYPQQQPPPQQHHIVPYSNYSGEQSNPTTTYSPQPKPFAPPTDYYQYYPQQESIPKPYVPNFQYSGEINFDNKLYAFPSTTTSNAL